ncbi:aminoglycoside phosphotransferase family protein [Nocardia arthritidis]
MERHGELLGRLLPGGPTGVREGQFHTVVVGAAVVVCFARTEAAAARLPMRAAVLRTVGRLDLGVAVPEVLGGNGVGDDAAYLVLSRIPGEPLESSALRDPELAEIVAGQCRAVLQRLAAAGADPAVRAELPVVAADRWREFADDVRAELYSLMSADGRRRAERELAALDGLPHRTDAVVHGDLGGENLLWEFDRGRPVLRGVIDWDGVCLGDPAEDYAALVAAYGAGSSRLLHGDDDDIAARIAIIQGTFALQQALDAHRDGDADELADGLAGYR